MHMGTQSGGATSSSKKSVEFLQSKSVAMFKKFLENRKMSKKEQYYIVRSYRAGVFAGYIKDRNGSEVTMTDARRIWYWAGAASLSQLSQDGVKRPGECKFAMTVPEMTIFDVIEIIPCTDVAETCIKAVPVWRV